MNYRIDIIDTRGLRIAAFDEVPLLKATRRGPDAPDVIEGILPGRVEDLGHGYLARVYVEGALFAEAPLTRLRPQWGDKRKLILERYVRFHELIEFEAVRPAHFGDGPLSRAYANRTASQIVRDAINRTPGAVHYLVNHGAYPDGAAREYQKFLARKTDENELEIGGIEAGQWAGGARIDATAAFAKDGDTISGLVVDGEAWPDVRLMLIDAEETTLNAHAIARHPETAGWTPERYDASGYKLRAEAAKDFLQTLIDLYGIDYIELNPHRDASGAFDDRVDTFGRYLGLVFGGGKCFNAALVELGYADVFLYEDGKFLAPELELKDFFSYRVPNAASIDESAETLSSYDVRGTLFEVLTAAGYVAGGYTWWTDADLVVHFRRADRPDRVVYFDLLEHAAALGSDSDAVANLIFFAGNPFTTNLAKTYANGESIDEFGPRARVFRYFSMDVEEDADKLVRNLLKDVAYPTPAGEIEWLHGDAAVRVGDLVELRGGALRRLERELEGEWDGRFAGRLVGRVREVTHRFEGDHVTTAARLTSPFRSIADPITFIVRNQPGASTLFQFRLDEATVGLDMGYHLD